MKACSPLRCLLLIVFLSAPVVLSSKSIVFKYDDGGNRISRALSVPELMMRKLDVTPRDVSSDVSLFDETIKIGPNPTSGIIKIEVVGYDDEQEFVAYVYNTSSQLVLKQKLVGSITELDISDRPNGIYIVGVISGDNCVSSKVVKQ